MPAQKIDGQAIAQALRAETAERVARHLAACGDCRRAVDEGGTDSFVNKLKAFADRGQTMRPGEAPQQRAPALNELSICEP